MKVTSIDINCDLGESYGNFKVGNDDAIFPHITSCNIACGFHGGDPATMERTIAKAIEYDVQIGAHPSYPDLLGFGRRSITIPPAELKSIVKYQVAALKGLVESQGTVLKYVKPHGALNHDALKDETIANAVCSAVEEIDPALAVMGFAGTHFRDIVEAHGLRFIPEAFADRRYLSNRLLVPRGREGAVIDQAEKAVDQVLRIVREQKVLSIDNKKVSLSASSVCVHGDHPGAAQLVRHLREALEKEGVLVQAFTV